MPLQVRLRPGAAARPDQSAPLANSLFIALTVIVSLLNLRSPLGLAVGRGSAFYTVLTYGFVHLTPEWLVVNVWVLWLFGNPVNRRIGNGNYLLVYLGSLVTLGLLARLFAGGLLLGASGAVFAIQMLFFLLMPRAEVVVGYAALFPVTLLLGLLARPAHAVYWLVRWDTFTLHAWAGLLLVPFLELFGLWWSGGNWTNLGHLLGLLCGVVAVLLLPSAVTLPRRAGTAP
jgi:membrane associated rhomboid family serine protease